MNDKTVEPDSKILDTVAKAVVTFCKKGGRGVLIPGNLILTAAHCIHFDADGAMTRGEHFVEKLTTADGHTFHVRPIAVEPVNDVAVLSSLDEQYSSEDASMFVQFCGSTAPVPLFRETPTDAFPVFVYSHTRSWVKAKATFFESTGGVFTMVPDESIDYGASGGPIVTPKGELVGVASVFNETPPYLGYAGRPLRALPVWAVERILTPPESDQD